MGSKGKQVGYQQLLAWQKADDLAVAIFNITRTLPPATRWLTDQACRAALSVPANIAEGYNRKSPKEYLQALNIARGSLAEVEYYIHFMRRVQLIDDTTNERIEKSRSEAAGLLFLLIKALRAKHGANPDGRSLRETSPPYDHPDPLTP